MVYNQLKQHPEKIKDELRIFVGETPTFKMIEEDHLPKQKGKLIELREHQQVALASLQTMRSGGEHRPALSCYRSRKNSDRCQ